MTVDEKRRVRAQRRAAGLCRCGRARRPDRATCARCGEWDRTSTAAGRRRRALRAMCRQCPRPVGGSSVFCREHRAAATLAAFHDRNPRWFAEDIAGEALDLFAYNFAAPTPQSLPPEAQ